ncbi:hypothetical protein AB205_0173190 [Aquarana catesbeiana]|uniref:Uncharacterized protein n=1 Tax=Aquarana catesbeiana TaxID=8400 RepID=A0A2G9RKF8_AQUCT|nr:hypothetical protein AB205_0173190 [Aquarana catesbeiana]
MSFMTGTIASFYSTQAVLITLAITAIVTIAVTVFCFQTKVDFTSCAGLFAVLGIVLFVTGIVTAIVLAFKYEMEDVGQGYPTSGPRSPLM